MGFSQANNLDNYGIKNIYEASIKTLFPITILDTTYEAGETILYFDEIQEISFQEEKNTATARGSFNSKPLIAWDETKEINGVMNLGTVNPISFGFLNKNILKEKKGFFINQFEKIYVGNDGIGILKHEISQDKKIHVYEIRNNQKVREILDFSIEKNTIILEDKNLDLFVDYYFYYSEGIKYIDIGQKDLNGYFMFVGKFRYTDEYSAVQKTGIFEIPKLRINSNFSITLGRNLNPLISMLQFQAIPTGDRENRKTLQIEYLEEDIDGD